ncbi:MAG TPA: FosX/FosE/FosI family fosfomycin resistance hydrolase [Spirochaetota bacterium]|nr:FosX/FosE/FosI family fosfomycin resistance hydrolase [Spirochaetota bacterium]HPC41907.1 FosX/FosE/FosI family fosfomycin resistance hydrolase [Spirochaetota bacterium]HPL18711.1 FosX/FosE/FosI family fosfomycin resistance hydrolase [Spirochaetota bacterium]HQF09617.1 FosX/FosE/FosI family fosfomycin resistance hydrolase [Spirochaetota bacterium]HQH98313.1 FosX/FosE/FosI family fosfomycin resistance hydrolase [Spirochaetota bacterium]
MIHGISHITLIVKDLGRSADLLYRIFGSKEIYSSGEDTHSRSREKFFLIGTIWFALMEGDSLKEKTYNHIAFRIADDEFDRYSEKIDELGLETIKDRKRIAGEGRSIYFYDYDNHLFELHTGSLDERLKNYRK